MKSELVAELRRMLQFRRRQLAAAIRTERQVAGEPYGKLAGEVPDAGDSSVADVAVDSSSAERERTAWELREVSDALERIALGGFGICQECGNPIPADRLRAFPTARYDLEHQELVERRMRKDRRSGVRARAAG